MIRLVESHAPGEEKRAGEPRPGDPVPPPPGGARAWTVEDAYLHCERIARSHYENFPVASRFVPAAIRPHVWALYAFARTADDFADEPRYAGRRAEALDDWEDRLTRCFYGEAEHPIFIALRDTVERRDIPISPLNDMLTAFRMDLTTNRYTTFEALSNYTRHSAVPVGQLLLYIFNYRDPSLFRYADDIATALEHTHFWQDLGSDLRRDHLYLPEEDLKHFGVREADLFAGKATPAFRDMMRFQVARTRSIFMRGRPLTSMVGRDLGLELGFIWEAGMAVLDRIDAAGGDVLQRNIVLGPADKVRMGVRAAVRRLAARRDK